MIRRTLTFLLGGVFIFMMLVPAFKYPNLTEVQLFMTFWPYYLGMIVSFALILGAVK